MAASMDKIVMFRGATTDITTREWIENAVSPIVRDIRQKLANVETMEELDEVMKNALQACIDNEDSIERKDVLGYMGIYSYVLNGNVEHSDEDRRELMRIASDFLIGTTKARLWEDAAQPTSYLDDGDDDCDDGSDDDRPETNDNAEEAKPCFGLEVISTAYEVVERQGDFSHIPELDCLQVGDVVAFSIDPLSWFEEYLLCGGCIIRNPGTPTEEKIWINDNIFEFLRTDDTPTGDFEFVRVAKI